MKRALSFGHVSAVPLGRPRITISMSMLEYAVSILILVLLGTNLLPILLGGMTGNLDEVEADSSNAKVRLCYLLIYAISAGLISGHPNLARKLFERSLPLVILLLFPFLTYIWSVTPGETLQRSIALVGSSLFGIYLGGRFDLKSIIYILAFSYGIIAFIDLVFVMFIPQIGIMHDDALAGAWQGVHGHKTGLGKAVSTGAVFATFALAVGSSRGRLIFAICLLLQIVLMLGARSLSGIMNFALGLGLIVLFSLIQLRYYRTFTIALVMTVSAGIMGLILMYNYGIGSALEAVGKNESMSSRFPLWLEVIGALKASPVLGFGYSAFWESGMPVVSRIASNLRFVPFYAHNGLLETMLNGGLVLTGYFLMYFALLCFLGFRYMRKGTIISIFPLVSLILFAIANFPESSILARNSSGWIIFVAVAFHLSIQVGISVSRKARAPMRWQRRPRAMRRPMAEEDALEEDIS